MSNISTESNQLLPDITQDEIHDSNISNFSRNEPIFYQTINEVPEGLEEQVNDLGKIADTVRKYSKDEYIPINSLLREINIVLKGKNPIYYLDDLIFVCTNYMNEYGVSASVLLKDLELILSE